MVYWKGHLMSSYHILYYLGYTLNNQLGSSSKLQNMLHDVGWSNCHHSLIKQCLSFKKSEVYQDWNLWLLAEKSNCYICAMLPDV